MNQNVYLFNDTVKNNITLYGDFSEREYAMALKLLFTGGKIGHDYRGLLRVPHPALHSDGIVSADPEHSDPDMTGLGLSKTSFTDR